MQAIQCNYCACGPGKNHCTEATLVSCRFFSRYLNISNATSSSNQYCSVLNGFSVRSTWGHSILNKEKHSLGLRQQISRRRQTFYEVENTKPQDRLKYCFNTLAGWWFESTLRNIRFFDTPTDLPETIDCTWNVYKRRRIRRAKLEACLF